MAKHTNDPICPSCEEKLANAHPTLVDWYRKVKAAFPNAHVSWSYRDKADQDAAVAAGKSKLAFPNSKHNKMPAEALDLFEIINDGAVWRPKFFLDVAQIDPSIVWGGSFKTISDRDHFELA